MTNDDVLYRSRLRLFALAKELGSVRAACRMLGVHHATYYRRHRQLLRFGPETPNVVVTSTMIRVILDYLPGDCDVSR